MSDMLLMWFGLFCVVCVPLSDPLGLGSVLHVGLK